jgi:toxin secretion/phage lysis holin
MKSVFVAICGGFAAVMTAIFGTFDSLAQVVVIMLVADYITGLVAAIINREVSSWKGFAGFLKKCLILVTIAVVTRIDPLIGAEGTLAHFSLWFYIGNEGISIVENLGRSGIPIPSFLKDIFIQIKKQSQTQSKKGQVIKK